MSKRILDFTYVHGFVAWIVCRLILFMAVCIYPALKTCLYLSENHTAFTDFQYSILNLTYWFMTLMMMGLYILHLFWTYYLIESFISVKMPAKAVTHSYD
jgi:hypothetical protein